MAYSVRLASVLLLSLPLAIVSVVLPPDLAGGIWLSTLRWSAAPQTPSLRTAVPGPEGYSTPEALSGDGVLGVSADAMSESGAPPASVSDEPTPAPMPQVSFLQLNSGDLLPDGSTVDGSLLAASALRNSRTEGDGGALESGPIGAVAPAANQTGFLNAQAGGLLQPDGSMPDGASLTAVALKIGRTEEAPPAARPAPPALDPAAPIFHTVVSGDTLWQIARNAGVSVRALAAVNHICEEDVLRLGEVLVLLAPVGPIQDVQSDSESCEGVSRPAAWSPRRSVAGAGAALQDQFVQQEHPGLVEGQMVWPSSGVVTSRFGWRTHPIFGTREFHTGVDIAASGGSPVLAARGGVVLFVGWRVGYGRIIIVGHGDGLETAYSHLSKATVQIGERVAEGQVIGLVGSTGWSTGPHLFFEIRRNGVPQNPLHYLN
jgi:murein DD-endopeptidase MepM/ murein hydrolase activator NlpD